MLRSLKAKFILAFGTLIVVLFAAVGLFLVDAKKSELSSDIAMTTQSFSQFTVRQVMETYDRHMSSDNFIPFSREISGILRKNIDVTGIKISSYSGVILYDSEQEAVEQYSGSIRTITDYDTLDRVQANNSSLLLEDGSIIYVEINENKDVNYVDVNEKDVDPLSSRDRIVDIVMPYDNDSAVFYQVSYASMEARLWKAEMQILLAAIVGVVLSLMISFMLSVSITNPLKALKAGAARIAKGDFSARVVVKTKDEVGVLAGTFNQMAEDLAAATEAKVYQQRMEKELELASQIQTDLLPKEELLLKTLDMSGGLVPASEIGGDAFDYIHMDSGRYLIYLGDVTGHGVPAGIVSSIANALLYGLRSEEDLKKILANLNNVIREKTTMKVFMTMALTLWDEQTRTAYYVNAGHPPVLYFDSEKKKVLEIKLPGVALGLTEDLVTQMQKIQLKPNDVLLMYSDGIPEAVNSQGDQYGMQRLRRIVQDAASDLYTAKGIKNAVLADVVEHIAGGERTDDMTVVVLKGKEDAGTN